MSQEMQSFEPAPSGTSLSAFQTWIMAVTKPSPETFVRIANDPGASPGKAYLWIFLGAVLSSIMGVVVQATTLRGVMEQSGLSGGNGMGFSFVTLLCGIPVGAIMIVVMTAIGVALIQLVARMFKGTGTYNQLLYTFAAFYVPISVVSTVLSLFGLIPFIGFCFGLLGLVLGIYALVLEVMAVKGVNNFGYGAAIGSVLIPLVVIFLIVFCCVLIAIFALGPTIGNVFSTINQSLGGGYY